MKHEGVDLAAIAVQPLQGDVDRSISVVDTVNLIQYVMCELRKQYAITGGKPSEERAWLLRREIDTVTRRDAIIIGLRQLLVLVLGASRAGATMVGGLVLGVNREAPVRLSLLLSIPAVVLGGLFEPNDVGEESHNAPILAMVIATIAEARCRAWSAVYRGASGSVELSVDAVATCPISPAPLARNAGATWFGC